MCEVTETFAESLGIKTNFKESVRENKFDRTIFSLLYMYDYIDLQFYYDLFYSPFTDIKTTRIVKIFRHHNL